MVPSDLIWILPMLLAQCHDREALRVRNSSVQVLSESTEVLQPGLLQSNIPYTTIQVPRAYPLDDRDRSYGLGYARSHIPVYSGSQILGYGHKRSLYQHQYILHRYWYYQHPPRLVCMSDIRCTNHR